MSKPSPFASKVNTAVRISSVKSSPFASSSSAAVKPSPFTSSSTSTTVKSSPFASSSSSTKSSPFASSSSSSTKSSPFASSTSTTVKSSPFASSSSSTQSSSSIKSSPFASSSSDNDVINKLAKLSITPSAPIAKPTRNIIINRKKPVQQVRNIITDILKLIENDKSIGTVIAALNLLINRKEDDFIPIKDLIIITGQKLYPLIYKSLGKLTAQQIIDLIYLTANVISELKLWSLSENNIIVKTWLALFAQFEKSRQLKSNQPGKLIDTVNLLYSVGLVNFNENFEFYPGDDIMEMLTDNVEKFSRHLTTNQIGIILNAYYNLDYAIDFELVDKLLLQIKNPEIMDILKILIFSQHFHYDIPDMFLADLLIKLEEDTELLNPYQIIEILSAYQSFDYYPDKIPINKFTAVLADKYIKLQPIYIGWLLHTLSIFRYDVFVDPSIFQHNLLDKFYTDLYDQVTDIDWNTIIKILEGLFNLNLRHWGILDLLANHIKILIERDQKINVTDMIKILKVLRHFMTAYRYFDRNGIHRYLINNVILYHNSLSPDELSDFLGIINNLKCYSHGYIDCNTISRPSQMMLKMLAYNLEHRIGEYNDSSDSYYIFSAINEFKNLGYKVTFADIESDLTDDLNNLQL